MVEQIGALDFAVLSLLVAGEVAGRSGGQRNAIYFTGRQKSIAILLTNTSQENPGLLTVKSIANALGRGEVWAGPAPVTGRSTASLLKPSIRARLRLLRTESDILPMNSETLFELSIASVPSGKVENQSVKVAMRSVLKLFWRPKVWATRWKLLRRLRWTRNSQGC
ncbi:fimbria/pilus periplasmic chaperone [Shigella flexneri]